MKSLSDETNLNRIYWGILIILIVPSIYPGASIVKAVGHPAGSDAVYHYKLVNGWLKGDNPLTDKEYFLTDSPYPPGFHLTIAFISKVLFISPKTVMNVFQILLVPLVLLSFFSLVYNRTDLYTGVLSTAFLSTSIAFHDRAGQVIPQAIDLLVFPIIIYFFLEKKRVLFILLGTFLVYNHGIYGILLLSALLVYSLWFDRGMATNFLAIFAFCIPLFLVFLSDQQMMIGSLTTNIGEGRTGQHLAFYKSPIFGLFYMGYFLFPFALVGIFHFAGKERTPFENILLLWVVLLIPLYAILPDRGISYAVQPLAIIAAMTIHETIKSPDKRLGLLGIVLIFSVIYTLFIMNDVGLLDHGWLTKFGELQRAPLYYTMGNK